MTTPELQLFTAETSEAREEAYWELLDRFAWEQKVDQKHLNALREKDPEHKHNHLNLLYSINAVEARDVFDVVYKAICKAYGTYDSKAPDVPGWAVPEAVALYARSLMPKTTDFAEIEQKIIDNISALLAERPQTREEVEAEYEADPDAFYEKLDNLPPEQMNTQTGHMVRISLSNSVLDPYSQGEWLEIDRWVVKIDTVLPGGEEDPRTHFGHPVEAVFTPGDPKNHKRLAQLVNWVLAL